MNRINAMRGDLAGWLPATDWFGRLSVDVIRRDALTGLTSATLTVPQAIAFAAIAGLPPQYGFYSAMIVSVIAALFGSSWQMVSGPATAISALIFLTLSGDYAEGSRDHIEAAIALTLMVGLFQIGFRILRLGQLVTFVSHSVIVGFTAGAAVLIALSQLKYALAVDLPHASDFRRVALGLVEGVPNANPGSLALCAVAFLCALLLKRFAPKAPNYLIALAAGSVLALMLPKSLGLTFVAPIDTVLPTFSLPAKPVSEYGALAPGAFAIALIGVLEAVSIARALALKSGQHLDANREIYGQGLSNAIGAFFSSFAGSGSFTRSALNQVAGAVTPLAVVFSAIWLLLIMLIFAPLVVYIPVSAMAGLIILVAWRLIDFPHIREILETSRSETVVLAVTFFGSLLVNLEFAIYAGVIVSLLLYLSKTMQTTLVPLAPNPNARFRTFTPVDHAGIRECPQMLLTRLQGPLYFGGTEHLRNVIHALENERPEQKHLFIRIEASSGVDLAGVHTLAEENDRRKARGGGLYVSCGYPPIRQQMKRLHLPGLLGPGHVFRYKSVFIEHVVPKLDKDICATCTARIFHECPPQKESSGAESISQGDVGELP